MRKDICRTFNAYVGQVYHAYVKAIRGPLNKDCVCTPYNTIRVNLNMSWQYNMNGGELTIRFIPYNNGTAVSCSYSIEQNDFANYTDHEEFLSTSVSQLIDTPAIKADINSNTFLDITKQVFSSNTSSPVELRALSISSGNNSEPDFGSPRMNANVNTTAATAFSGNMPQSSFPQNGTPQSSIPQNNAVQSNTGQKNAQSRNSAFTPYSSPYVQPFVPGITAITPAQPQNKISNSIPQPNPQTSRSYNIPEINNNSSVSNTSLGLSNSMGYNNSPMPMTTTSGTDFNPGAVATAGMIMPSGSSIAEELTASADTYMSQSEHSKVPDTINNSQRVDFDETISIFDFTPTPEAKIKDFKVDSECPYTSASIVTPATGEVSEPATVDSEPDAEAPEPAIVVPVPDAEAPVPAIVVPVPDAEAPVPAIVVPVPDAEAPESAIVVPEPDAEAPEPAIVVPVPDAEAPEPAAITSNETSSNDFGEIAFCPNCGKAYFPETFFCAYCGKPKPTLVIR